MSVFVTLQILQFVFDWIAATVIGVQWCYTFKMTFPQYSETILGWSLYTLVLIIAMPFFRMWLLNRLGTDDDKHSKGTQHGWKLLLSITCAYAVGTALSGLAALLFPGLASARIFSPGLSAGTFIAGVMTILFVLLQAAMEWVFHVGMVELPQSSYWKQLLSILLCSTWTFLGFFWNSVWDLQLRVAANYISAVAQDVESEIVNGSQGIDWTKALTPRGPALVLIGQAPTHAMQTIPDAWHGRPAETTLGMWWMLGKAVVTMAVAMLTLYLLPDPPPIDERRFVTRRFRLAAQMVVLTVAAYATTDVGFYFGTRYVARQTSSEWLGLLVAFAYSLLISCAVCAAGYVHHFQTRTNFGKWCFQLACFDVCYAWWYCWQELLCQIQGYSPPSISDFMEAVFLVTWAISQNLLMTFLFVHALKHAARLAVSVAMANAADKDEAVDADLLGTGSSISDSMRFLTACCGIELRTELGKRDVSGGKYGGADVAAAGVGNGDAA